ncbi:methyltransferase domain-containing protein [Streptomyces sp. ICBB 8177]|uniref:methyltransferase domain-containing protein n=1 Tax=Streptomyces sp. ICBB 8177 TaxID=563922 RepID=UPI0026BE111A
MTIRPRKERATRTELGRLLRDKGALTPGWEAAFETVDRAAFLPTVMWPHRMADGSSTRVDKATDPDAWYEYADSDEPITTQWDGGRPDGQPGTVPTSSCSAPSVVFRMLDDLDLADGMRVLEIGTGTGWNAALLAHRAGAANVVTVEIDPQVAETARGALDRNGFRVGVREGDGCVGRPGAAPFDRLMATFGVRDFPRAWVRQVRPGGVIVAPWGTHFTHRDVVVELRVDGDGRAASGRFLRLVEFMKDRGRRATRPGHEEYLPDGWPGGADALETRLPADAFEPFTSFEFTAGLRVPGCELMTAVRDGARNVWLYSLTDRSWAAALYEPGQSVTKAYQAGGRRLWDEVETAYAWWQAQGSPDVDRFGLTVTAGGLQAWLDEPGAHWSL